MSLTSRLRYWQAGYSSCTALPDPRSTGSSAFDGQWWRFSSPAECSCGIKTRNSKGLPHPRVKSTSSLRWPEPSMVSSSPTTGLCEMTHASNVTLLLTNSGANQLIDLVPSTIPHTLLASATLARCYWPEMAMSMQLDSVQVATIRCRSSAALLTAQPTTTSMIPLRKRGLPVPSVTPSSRFQDQEGIPSS